MIFFVTVAAVIITAMLIGDSRSKKATAMTVASSAADIERSQNAAAQNVDTNAVRNDTTSSATASSSPQTKTAAAATAAAKALPAVPNRGSVQVLNGCGAEGAANRVADFLRSKGFDVKDIGNASSWNHQSTMVISRTADMGLADDIEKLLKTGKVVKIRQGDDPMYDVTVVAGPDFEERIK